MPSIFEALSQLGAIFYQVCLPILLLVGLGFAVQRVSGLQVRTLKTLTFFVTLPAVIFSSIVTSSVPPADIGRVLLFVTTFLVAGGALFYLALAIHGVDPRRRRAIIMMTVNPNAGNFGFPVQDLVFQPIGRGAEAQTILAFVIIAQNLINFTLGVVLLATGRQSGKPVTEHLKTILTFPPLYALVSAIAVKQIGVWLESGGSAADPDTIAAVVAPVWQVLTIIRGAFVPLALLTLGAQLGTMDLRAGERHVALSVVLRTLVGPAFAVLLLTAFDISGFLAQVLFLAFAGPSAVNAMLLCLEFDTEPELAARTVLYTTLVAPGTITIMIFLATGGFFGRFAL